MYKDRTESERDQTKESSLLIHSTFQLTYLACLNSSIINSICMRRLNILSSKLNLKLDQKLTINLHKDWQGWIILA
ncbi:CLUMA_CG004686, isoform A [Clunio marinus]|uniref:CLUMA_CG004686, isoform A n=1 Tax=Clunio marinus TaxID=568069 RepID=A0A1J1HWU3_9DIPT|nr:CLUMA_CG004686, isoform A [Clunio marinus]